VSGLQGKRVLITAGPTLEPIDAVRFISNRSSGKQGYAIASACAALGAEVILVSGPTCLEAPDGVTRRPVETARGMLAAVQGALPADVFIAVAAVADWRPETAHAGKPPKDAGEPALRLVENPDILKSIAQGDPRPALVIGFAAETGDLADKARAKRVRKGADWIIANDVSGDAMGGEDNAFLLITDEGEEAWPRLPKAELADRLAARIAAAL